MSFPQGPGSGNGNNPNSNNNRNNGNPFNNPFNRGNDNNGRKNGNENKPVWQSPWLWGAVHATSCKASFGSTAAVKSVFHPLVESNVAEVGLTVTPVALFELWRASSAWFGR